MHERDRNRPFASSASPAAVRREAIADGDIRSAQTPHLRERVDVPALLALQRSAGNRVVAGMLARQPDDPNPRDAARARIRDLKRELDAITEQAQDVVREATGDHAGGSPAPKRRQWPPPKPGSKQSRAALRDWVRRGLQDIVDGKGPDAARAKRLLDELDGVEKEIAELEQGLRPPQQPKFESNKTPADKQPAKSKNPPAKTPPAKAPPAETPPAKAPPAETPPAKAPPAKTSPAAGGGVAKAELDAAAKEANVLRRFGGKVVSGLQTLAKYAGPALQAALALLQALDAIEMTESGLSGQGWVLKRQVAQSKVAGRDAAALVGAHDAARFHTDVQTLVETAKRNDDKFAQLGVNAEYWSTVELSEFCERAWNVLSDYVHACEELLASMTRVLAEAAAGEKVCEEILGSLAAGVDPASAPAFGARMDFRDIEKSLGAPTARLEAHVAQSSRDLDLLYDNILEHGWAL
jgi:hypothetical protein